ncbi:MAG: cation diffusion facilitator family transporter [Sulfurovum sp.]|nr:cation diffusion facilitator family transporter [Sulfurovum sp.]MCB4749830.1 cation diffusion facilitator family transporter [Sulfurovum sp.]MCB4753240.1 cation diffusion facilitator family transporter [Sulfurovum sp.]MCB4761495.1 cation diffusion facilitator family transporter [Sulfurovum sp.]MCB4764758.1 cation diffusion facilitator family transporter [Sulfurovum sp.]
MSPQKKATVISTSVAALLVFVKLMIGIASGSVAVLASAIDSLLDMGVSIFNFFAIKKTEEAPNEEYHYGKGKIQAIAGVIEGTIITISGLYIIYVAIEKLMHHKETILLVPSIVAMVVSIVMTWLLVRYLLDVAKETDNIVIKADALHYKTDLWSNAAVLIALVLVSITGIDTIDAVFGTGIGLYIIYSAYEIIVEGVGILLDKALDSNTIAKIDEIISNHPEVTSYHWLRTRTDGSTNFVEFHMVLRPNMLLLEAHRIADEVEEKIMPLDSNKRWVITPHFDPYDDEDMNEAMLHGKPLVDLEKIKKDD